MSFKLTVEKLSGNPDSSGWSQTYDYKPQDPEKFALRGHLSALISTSSQDRSLDTVVAGREVISRLHEEYYGKLLVKPYIALKEAVEKVIDEFSSSGSIEAAAVAVVDSTIYMAVGGGASVFLYRQEKLFKLVESVFERVIAASGNPLEKDRIIIASKAFIDSFSLVDIKESLETDEPVSVIETYAPLVHSKKEEGSFGILVIHFDEITQKPKIKPLLGEDKEKDNMEGKLYKKPEGAFIKVKQGFLEVFKRSESGGVYLKSMDTDGSRERNKKTSFLVGVLLLLILSVSIYFGVQQKNKTDFKATYESQLVSAEHELQESYTLYLLNPQRSRELFDQARNKVLGLSMQGINDPNLEDLKQKIVEGEEKILGLYETDPQLFVDLNLFSEGFKIDDVAFSSDVAYVLYREGKKIVEIDLLNKRAETYAGPSDVRETKNIAAYSGRVFTSTSDGLYELDNGRIKIAYEGGEGILMGAYAGNLYLLDKSTSKIYRYPADDSGFGNKKEWLRSGIEINLTGVRSMVIDGAIWVVSDQDELMKFSLGNPQNFGFNGIFPEIEKITDIFTDEESQFLYVLERDKKRVIVAGKDGEYKVQYKSEGMGDAGKLVVIEKEKKAFLLTSDRILSFELKHLE